MSGDQRLLKKIKVAKVGFRSVAIEETFWVPKEHFSEQFPNKTFFFLV